MGKTLWNVFQVAVVMGLLGFTGVSVVRFWKNSSSIRVKTVVFQGDIPSLLRSSFPIKPEQNLILMQPSRLEKEWLKKLPELKSLSVRRSLDRRVSVSGKFREPFARLAGKPGEWGVDQSGRVFSVDEWGSLPDDLPWVGAASNEDLMNLLQGLSTWKMETPDFYSLVKKIETDKMHATTVELRDGVNVQWGELDQRAIVERTKKLLRLRELFEPRKTPAQLIFVTHDRIVMDANWKEK